MTPLAERLEAALLITRTAARRFGDDALTTSGWKPHPTRMETPSTIAPGLNSYIPEAQHLKWIGIC